MADNLTAEQRKRNMTAIKSRHTKPEKIVRSIIHRMGFRFRLHDKKLPGKPDIVLPRHKKIILVHGCFWHMHDCKRGNVTPKTNTEYWQKKRFKNVERDRQNLTAYKKEGWKVLTVWECEIKDLDKLKNKLLNFLNK
ncbi:MAG: DNA mismatch endonuclease Vsr [Acidobacteriota bacterium]|jgi:DNA mismatch endonuclease (patch repair protein)|nr:DNA mismatch endonuclease Vsr [Acidobacteriota bacterium]